MPVAPPPGSQSLPHSRLSRTHVEPGTCEEDRAGPRKPQPQFPRATRYLLSTAAMKPSGSMRLMVSELTFSLRNSALACRGV